MSQSNNSVYVNCASFPGGVATLWKGILGAQVLVFRTGEKSTLIHTENCVSVAAAKQWRNNNAKALLASRNT